MAKRVIIGILVVFGFLMIVGLFAEPEEPTAATELTTSEPAATPEATATPEPTATPAPPTPTPTPKPPPPTATPQSFRDMVEACLSPWDGNHDGFEDQIRPLLNNEDSMQTHSTRFAVEPGVDGRSLLLMEYSAENVWGGRVKLVAGGLLDPATCYVEVVTTGLE